jgi:hypothetical protein
MHIKIHDEPEEDIASHIERCHNFIGAIVTSLKFNFEANIVSIGFIAT